MTTSQRLTVRDIRTILFNSERYTVIGSEEMTNKESRDFLYVIKNQDLIFNVIDNGTHLLIF